MGFSVAAAGGILVIGLLATGTFLAQSYLTSQNQVQGAMKEAEARIELASQGELQVDNVTLSAGPQKLWVNATNLGSVTYNTAKLDVLIDGVVRTTDVTAKKVDGATTNVWPPLTRLELQITQASAPSSVQVVAPNGVQAFWRA